MQAVPGVKIVHVRRQHADVVLEAFKRRYSRHYLVRAIEKQLSKGYLIVGLEIAFGDEPAIQVITELEKTQAQIFVGSCELYYG